MFFDKIRIFRILIFVKFIEKMKNRNLENIKLKGLVGDYSWKTIKNILKLCCTFDHTSFRQHSFYTHHINDGRMMNPIAVNNI